MDAGQGFVDTLPVYAIMPNPSPQYVVAIKLSNELLQHLQTKGTSGMTITFGSQNIITVGNEQFSFRAPPEEHGVSDCYRQVDDEEGGTFTKVGVVKRKIFVTQKLREEDRKRVKTATETHENARLSHKSVLIDATGNQLMSKDGKRKTTTTISKPPPTVIKRNRIETSSTRPQLSSLSSLASKHTTSSKLSSPKRPPPLRSQIIQMLALEGLTHEQIEAKCPAASKTALASTLQQVAKTKGDGLYHLKKEVYTEVDTNWSGFTPEDRARVIERRALALQPDSEKKKDSDESTEGLPAPEPSALEAKATGARYPSPLPRALAAVRERPKEEKVVPARLAPPSTTTTTSISSTTAKAEAAAAATAAAKEAAAKEAAAKEAAAKEAAAKEAAAAAAKERELKERERERELVRERERAKERERERQRERERELREKEKEKEKEKERERGLAGGRESSSSKQQYERSPKDPSPARSSASSSAASSPSGSPASQAQAGTGSSPGKAKEEVPPPSAPRNGEHKRKRTEQPSREYNGTSSSAKAPNISMSEYKRRRVEWEKNYKEYCDLHRKLKENARFFEELGGQLKKASDADKTKLVQRISADYQKRISRVRQWKKRFTFLHAEVKKEKAALLALHPHPS